MNDKITANYPAEHSPWGKFALDSLKLDSTKGKLRVWHWFWGFYYLDNILPNFNFEKIRSALPDKHWLKEEPNFSELEYLKIRVDALIADLGQQEDKSKINFSGMLFGQQFDFSYFLFPLDVSFERSQFSNNIKFNLAKFQGVLNFTNTTFDKKANFNKTHFFDNVDFKNVEVQGYTNFANTVFHQNTNFENIKLHHYADFEDAKFHNNVKFKNAKFYSYADFENAEFHKNVNFKDVSFVQDTYFTGATFSETADFEKATFSGKTAKFRNTTFTKIVNFKETTFNGYANFKTSTFDGRTIFQKAKFELHTPRFYGAKFNNEMILNGITLPKTLRSKEEEESDNDDDYQKRIEENQSAYETLVFLMETLNKYHDKHFFFREEMRWRQLENKLKQQELKKESIKKKDEWCFSRRRIKKSWQRFENALTIIFYWLYENLADYGYGIGRAFTWWLANICLWTGMLFFFGYEHIQFTFERLARSFLASLSNAHSFFLSKSERVSGCCNKNESTLIFDMIWAVETILGVLFLFLFLLTLRIRFRLK